MADETKLLMVKMSVDLRDAKIALQQLQSQVEKTFTGMERSAKGSVGGVNNAFSGLTGTLKRVAGAIATAFTVHEVVNFGKKVVEAAADIEAMEAAFEQVFTDKKTMKSYTKEATDYLQGMCEEFDMELNSLKGDFTSFASQYLGLGMDMETAMEYAKNSLTLAADAAAMYNKPLEQAIDNVRSFMKGNYIGGESVQLFGSQTMLAAYAVEQGIIKEAKAFKELSEAEKQIIRNDYAKYQYDLAGTTGQAARESDMYQNQLTKLKRKWEDFKAVLGTKALESLVGAFKSLGDIIDQFPADKMGEGFGGAMTKIAEWVNKVDWLTLRLQIETIWEDLKGFLGDTWQGLKDNFQPVVDAVEAIFSALGITSETESANTENMDAANKFLLNTKDEFKWLADHGQETADAITAIIKAMALWKGLKIGLSITDFFFSTDGKGNKTWGGKIIEGIVSALGLSTEKGTLGAAIASGLSGFGSVVAALTIPFVLAITFEWWGTEEQKKQAEKRREEIIGADNKTLNVNKETGKRDTFDWEETKKSLLASWNDFQKWLDELDIGTKIKEAIFPSLKDKDGNKITILGELKDLWNGISNWWDSSGAPTLEKIVTFFKNFFIRAANAVTGGKGVFGKSFSDVIDDAISQLNIKLNSLIGTINAFFEELGLSTRIGSVTFGSYKKYYKNTSFKNSAGGKHLDAHADGVFNKSHSALSLVGEAGRELVADPKLGTFMANSPTVLNLSKGATVLSNKNTEKFLKSFGVKAYAKGKNEGGFWSNVWSYVKNPNQIVDEFFKNMGIGGSKFHEATNELLKGGIKSGVLEYIKGVLNSEEATSHPDHPNNQFGGTGGGFTQAMGWAKKALEIAGYVPSMKQYRDFMTAFKIVGRYESNYNNSAINKTDKNAQKGTPSAGWLQFIQPTFKSNAFRGYNNWGNGLHQALAFINYANRRYGGPLNIPGVKSILRGGKYKPYANGGLITNPTMALMGEAGTEAVVPLSNARALKPFGQSVLNAIQEEANTASSGGVYEFVIPVVVDGREIAKATATFTKQELDKLDKRNNRLNGRK